MKRILFLTVVLSMSTQLFAQVQRFKTTVSNDTSETDFGKNKKNNVSFTMQVGAYMLSEKAFQPYYSTYFGIAVEYNHKVAEWYSYGFDFNFGNSGFVMSKKQADKTFPDTIIHQRENITITSLGSVLYQRINFFNKHRGEILGNYLDIGVYGNLHVGSFYYYRDNEKIGLSNFFSKKQDVYYRGLDFITLGDYGAVVRLGRNWFSVFARYRLSELMKSSYKKDYAYPEMPNFITGIRVVF